MQVPLKEREGISSWRATLNRDFWPWQLAEKKALWENGLGIKESCWGRYANPSLDRQHISGSFCFHNLSS